MRAGLEMALSSEQKRCQDQAVKVAEVEAQAAQLTSRFEAMRGEHLAAQEGLKQKLWQSEEQVRMLESQQDSVYHLDPSSAYHDGQK